MERHPASRPGGWNQLSPARRRHCGRRVPRRSLGPAPCARRQQSARRPGRGRRSCPKRGRRLVRLRLSKARSRRGAVSQAARVAGAQGPPRSRRTARGRPQQPGRPLALLFSARRLSTPSSIILTRRAKYVKNLRNAKVLRSTISLGACGSRRAHRHPTGYPRCSFARRMVDRAKGAAAGRQLAACRDGRLSQSVTLVRVGHLAVNLGDSPPAPPSPLQARGGWG